MFPFPAVQVYVSQAEAVVVPVVLGVMVKANVCVLQPETNVGAVDGVLVYVFPFPADQVYVSQAETVVVPVVFGVMVKFNVSLTAQPLPFVVVPV